MWRVYFDDDLCTDVYSCLRVLHNHSELCNKWLFYPIPVGIYVFLLCVSAYLPPQLLAYFDTIWFPEKNLT